MNPVIIRQQCQKALTDRARRAAARQQTVVEDAPPPYESDEDDEDEDDENKASPTLKLTINAPRNIRGSGNIISTGNATHSIAAEIRNALSRSVERVNNTDGPHQAPHVRRTIVHLTINCGLTIIGNQNVVGPVAVKPKPAPGTTSAAPAAAPQADAVQGAKRKADDCVEEVSAAKRVNTRSAARE